MRASGVRPLLFIKSLPQRGKVAAACRLTDEVSKGKTIPPSFSCENDTSLYTREAEIIVVFVVEELVSPHIKSLPQRGKVSSL